MSNSIEVLDENTALMTYSERFAEKIREMLEGSKRVKVSFADGLGNAAQTVLVGKTLGPAFSAETPEEAHNATFGIAGSVTIGRRLPSGHKLTSKVSGWTV